MFHLVLVKQKTPVHPKMKVLALFTNPRVLPDLCRGSTVKTCRPVMMNEDQESEMLSKIYLRNEFVVSSAEVGFNTQQGVCRMLSPYIK